MDHGPAFWALVIFAIITMVWSVVRPMTRKKDPLSKPPAYASLSRQRTVEREMQNVLVELSEMTRQISAQLDTRSAKLQILIKDADERIAALKAAGGAPAQVVAVDVPIVDAPQVPPGDSGQSFPDPRYAEIYAMADGGRSAKEIAQQLNRPAGEVELILALRR